MSKRRILSIFAIAVSTAFSVYAQNNKQKQYLADKIYQRTLKNKFTYFICENQEPKNRVYLYLTVKAGSILEDDDQIGGAHFLEHMAFNGTTHFPGHNATQYMEQHGLHLGSDFTAATSTDYTTYKISIPADNDSLLYNSARILRDFAHGITLDPAEFEAEKGVIIGEFRFRIMNAAGRITAKVAPILFNNSGYVRRYQELGTLESIEHFQHEALERFYQTWYRPDMQALIIVGNVDSRFIETKIIPMFSDLRMPKNARIPKNPSGALTERNNFLTVTDDEKTNIEIRIYMKHRADISDISPENVRKALLSEIYNGIMARRFTSLTAQYNAPFRSADSHIEELLKGSKLGLNTLTTWAEWPADIEPDALKAGFKSLVSETERVKRFGFRKEELTQFLPKLYEKYSESPHSKLIAEKLALSFATGKQTTLLTGNSMLIILKTISLEELNDYAQGLIRHTDRDIIVTGPTSAAAKLPTKLQLTNWISEVTQSDLAPYHPDDQEIKLSGPPDPPTSFVKIHENKIKSVNVTELMLPNRIKIVLKPLMVHNNQVSFRGFKPGGTTAALNEEDTSSQKYITKIVNEVGVAKIDKFKLHAFLAHHGVTARPFIQQNQHGIRGSFNTSSTEIALQSIYGFIHHPYLSRDAKKHLVSNGIDSSSINNSYQLYKKIFSDMNNYIFLFIGDFEAETLKCALLKYLLPPSKDESQDSTKATVSLPDRKVVVYKGISNVASVTISFMSNYQFSTLHNLYIDCLSDILRKRIHDRIREDESGSYTPRVIVRYSRYPPRFNYTISFNCAPAQSHSLINSALAETRHLATTGPSKKEIQQFISNESLQMKLQSNNINSWIEYLTRQYTNDANPGEIIDRMSLFHHLTEGNLAGAAQKYFNEDNRYLRIQLPEICKDQDIGNSSNSRD